MKYNATKRPTKYFTDLWTFLQAWKNTNLKICIFRAKYSCAKRCFPNMKNEKFFFIKITFPCTSRYSMARLFFQLLGFLILPAVGILSSSWNNASSSHFFSHCHIVVFSVISITSVFFSLFVRQYLFNRVLLIHRNKNLQLFCLPFCGRTLEPRFLYDERSHGHILYSLWIVHDWCSSIGQVPTVVDGKNSKLIIDVMRKEWMD